MSLLHSVRVKDTRTVSDEAVINVVSTAGVDKS